MSLTKKQKDQVNYLVSALATDDATALDCLKKSNWDSDRAADLYLNSHKPEKNTQIIKKD